ncbi:MAG: hypothetical protein AAF702_26490 [Chloroflexota bacterium]
MRPFIRLYLLLLFCLTSMVIGVPFNSAVPTIAASRNDLTAYESSLDDLVPLDNVIQVAAGYLHTCVLTSLGNVKCWGGNIDGQLGDGTTINRPTPVSVSGLVDNVVAISAGSDHTCALLNEGSVRCWGNNEFGQLGDGTLIDQPAPVVVTGLASHVIGISAGVSHTCALVAGPETNETSVQCWGQNQDGQLGNGSTTNRVTPVAVAGLSGSIIAIAAGSAHTCAIVADDTAKSVTTSTFMTSTVNATNTDDNSSAYSIHSAQRSPHGADTTGGLKCWGKNDLGQLGDGTNTNRTTPTDVSGLATGVQAVSIGGGIWDFGSHTCSLILHSDNSNEVQCWGYNGWGQLGDGTTINRATPVLVNGLNSEITHIALGRYHTCALSSVDDSATVSCWGLNYDNQLGESSISSSNLPLDLSGLTDATAVVAGDSHNCAITDTKSVQCWGRNYNGQLGDGMPTNYTTPIVATELGGDIVAITVGEGHTCVLTQAGSVKCTGLNLFGQLGNNTNKSTGTPVDVTDLAGKAIAISGGDNFTCAVTDDLVANHLATNYQPTDILYSDPFENDRNIATNEFVANLLTSSLGSVQCWGDNRWGQLGDGTSGFRTVPVNVANLDANVITVSAGGEQWDNASHTCALTRDSVSNEMSVQCWGDNRWGQLGNQTTTNSPTPVAVHDLAGALADISSGGYHTCVLAGDENTPGGVQCWGYNFYGQLGDGTITDRSIPVDVSNLNDDVTAISSGDYHTCAITDQGSLKCWGRNSWGQLGNDSTLNTTIPVDVVGLAANVKSVSSGHQHTCAIVGPSVDNEGGAKCWGINYSGQLGDGTTAAQGTAVDVIGLGSGVTMIAAGYDHTCVLLSDGSVNCWGRDNYGQLGIGRHAISATPIDVMTTACFTLTLNHSGSGSEPTATPTKSEACDRAGEYVTGQAITLTARPSTGWQVSSWSGTSNDNGTSTSNSLTMPAANYSVSVTYSETPASCFDLSISHSGNGADPSPSPKNSNQCTEGQYTEGELISLTASPDADWQVSSWRGTSADSSTSHHNSLTMPAANHSASVTYSKIPIPCFALSLEHSGNGLDPTPSPTNSPPCALGQYVAGEAITFTASPSPDWQVSSWRGTSDNSSTSTSNSLTMPSNNHTVGVTYSEIPTPCFTLSLNHNGNGEDPTPLPANSAQCSAGQYVAGEMIDLTASPSTDWEVSGWSGTSNDNSTSVSNSLTMPSNNHAVSVTYTQSPKSCFTLTLSHAGSGPDPTASPSNSASCPQGQYVAGEVVTLFALPPNGFHVRKWRGTRRDGSPTTTNQLTMPADDHAVVVTYGDSSVMLPYLSAVLTPTPTLAPTPTPTPTPEPAWQRLADAPLRADTLAINGTTLFVTHRNNNVEGGGIYQRDISGCVIGNGFVKNPSINAWTSDIEFVSPLGLTAAFNNGLYLSQDNGATWHSINGIDGEVYSVAFAQGAGYASADDIIYKSVDGGGTWTNVAEIGIPINVMVYQNEILWLGTNGDGMAQLPLDGLGGLNPRNDGLTSPKSKQVWDIYIDVSGTIYIATYDGVFKSDGTGPWQPVGANLAGYETRALASVGSQLYVGTREQGTYRIPLINPQNWIQVTNGASGSATWTVRGFLYDEVHCNGLLAGTDDGVWLLR